MAKKKTQSENIFEKYCSNSEIQYHRITEGSSATPDYYLMIDGQKIVVEVKEIDNKAEIRLVYKSNGLINFPGWKPGERVRNKIKYSSKQIKARTEGIYPSLLVLFYSGIAPYLDPYEIRIAMYGLEQVHVNLPSNPSISPYITGISYGPNRKMTEEHNTSISAIGILFAPGPNEFKLCVYHNKFAAVPLDPRLLAKYDIPQFELEDEAPGNTAKWKEIVVTTCPE
jgi:hypothetical protein